MGPRIAVIGIGRMGLAISTRLAQAGFEVIASDVLPGRETNARARGATRTGAPGEAAAAADVALTILPGSRELDEVASAIVPRLAAGTTWIDLTTASPSVASEWVARAQARGVHCLDAPMGGGVEAAEAGSLQFFVGGGAEVVERLRALLGTLGTIDHMGDNGAGYTTKLLVNLLWFGQAVATGEALLLARRSGIDLHTLQRTLTRSAAASSFIDHAVPALLQGDYFASYGLDRCADQLTAVTSLADAHEVPFDLSSAVHDVFLAAVQRFGAVDGELLPIALLEERAGTRLAHNA